MKSKLFPESDEGDAHHEVDYIAAEFGDLGLEENRVAYINALIMNRVVPPTDARDRRLEASIFQIERCTMRKVVSTFTQMAKAHCERATVMLKRLESRYVAQGGSGHG